MNTIWWADKLDGVSSIIERKNLKKFPFFIDCLLRHVYNEANYLCRFRIKGFL